MLSSNRPLLGDVLFRWLLILCLPELLCVFPGCTPSDPSPENQSINSNELPVNVMEAKRVVSEGASRRFHGSVNAAKSVQLGFTRGGRVAEIHVDEGQLVEANELLVELDIRRLDQKRKQLVAARDNALQELAALPEVVAPLAPQALINGLTSIQGQVLELRNKLVQAAGAQQPQPVDTAQALSRLEQSVSDLNTPTVSRRGAELESLAADLNRQIDDADLELEEGRIRAPFPGEVSLLNVGLGIAVSAGLPVVRVLDTHQLQVTASLPADIAKNLTPGELVSAEVDGESHELETRFVSAELDPVSTTRQVTFILNQPRSGKILPGSVAQLELMVAGGESGFWLPRTALTRPFQGLWSVLVAEPVDNNWIARRKYVEVLQLDADRLLVSGSLRDGELVIADGIQRVVPGQRVSPLLQGEADPASPGTEQTEEPESMLSDEGGDATG